MIHWIILHKISKVELLHLPLKYVLEVSKTCAKYGYVLNINLVCVNLPELKTMTDSEKESFVCQITNLYTPNDSS